METRFPKTPTVKQLSRRRFIRLAAGTTAGGMLVSLLAACQPAAPAQPTTAPAAAPTTAPAAPAKPAATSPAPAPKPTQAPAAAAKPPAGGSITIALSLAIDTMDPAVTSTTMLNSADKVVFDCLTWLDKDNNLLPGLATKWDVSSDGTVWTFTLRPGVKFHDGTPFNSQAAKINYDRILDKNNNILRRNVISNVIEVKAPNETTFQVRTEKPFGPMPWYVGHPGLGFHSPAAIQKYGPKDVGLHPVGTGPFKVQSYPSTDRLELVRNPDYWDGAPPAEKMTFVAAREDASRLAMLQTGEADVIVNVPPSLADTIKGNQQLKLVTGPSNRVAGIEFNMLKPQWQDVRVRRALNHAVDKDTLIKSVMRGYAKAYPSPFTPFSFGYSEIYQYEYNVNKAKELLAEAGWKPASDGNLSPDGKPFKMTIETPTNRYLLDAQTTEAVTGYLKAVGINAVSKPVEWATFWSVRRGNEAKEVTDTFYMAWADPNGDMSYAMQQFESRTWSPGQNFNFYKRAEIDKLAADGVELTDPEKRKPIYKQIQQTLMDDAPYIFLYGLDTLAASRANVSGVELHPAEYYLLAKVRKG